MNIDDPQEKKDQQKELDAMNKIWEQFWKKWAEARESHDLAMREHQRIVSQLDINNKEVLK